jgi:hypothetical protein
MIAKVHAVLHRWLRDKQCLEPKHITRLVNVVN